MEEIIKKYVQLDDINAKGWHTTKCAVCNDYKIRAGFLFDNGNIGYHCFNCSTKAKYQANHYISKTMQEVLLAFGIPTEDIQRLNFNSISSVPNKNVIEDNKLIELPLPYYFSKITDTAWSRVAIEYLNSRSINEYDKFLICEDKDINNWYGRLIIPFYREGKLVYYQGRGLNNSPKRYMNANTGDTTILYNYDEIFKTKDILFVVEGVFDAFHLNGVAILGNELSDKKIKIINQSKRRKVYIPDRTGGYKTALNALAANWEIALPDIGNCKDINEAIVKYGYLYVYRSIMENIKGGFEGKLLVKTYCK